MKTKSLLILIFPIVLAACAPAVSSIPTKETITGPSSPTLSKTPSILPTSAGSFVYPANATPLPNGKPYFPPNLSPDQKWVATINQDTGEINITAIAQRKTLTTSNALFSRVSNMLGYDLFLEWFPNSTGFMIFGNDGKADNTASKRWNRIVLYQINVQENDLEAFVLEPLPIGIYWPEFSWAPDMKNFALIVADQAIYVINQKAELVQTIRPSLGKSDHITEVTWTKYGIVYLVLKYSNDVLSSQMHLMMPDNQQDLLLSNDDVKTVLSVDPYTPRIMLFISGFYCPEVVDGIRYCNSKIVTFNLETKQIDQTVYSFHVPQDSDCLDWPVDASPFVGVTTCDPNENLFIFDWATRTLDNKHLHAEMILPWRSDLESFIILNGQYPNQWLETVSP